MLVDLDSRFIQYWVNGIHQQYCIFIYNTQEVELMQQGS